MDWIWVAIIIMCSESMAKAFFKTYSASNLDSPQVDNTDEQLVLVCIVLKWIGGRSIKNVTAISTD